jgi:hypothetical protein
MTRNGPAPAEKQEWTIPLGHPTREIAFVSHGQPTTAVLRHLEKCFDCKPGSHHALPEKTAMVFQVIILRGIVNPIIGRFTAKLKIITPEVNGWPYSEFYLYINSETKKIWFSEKSAEYRSAILARLCDPVRSGYIAAPP